MAGTLGIIEGRSVRNSGLTVAGLVQGQAGTNITQATLTSVTYTVTRTNWDGTTTITGTNTLTVSSVVFDTAQTADPRYTKAGGYNFLAVLPATCFVQPGRFHTVEILFVPVSGQQFEQIYSTTPL